MSDASAGVAVDDSGHSSAMVPVLFLDVGDVVLSGDELVEGKVFVRTGTQGDQTPTESPESYGEPLGSFTFFGDPDDGLYSFAFSLAQLREQNSSLFNEILTGNGRAIITLTPLNLNQTAGGGEVQARVIRASVK